jgi:hypothetical protein
MPLAALLSISVCRHAFPGLKHVSGVGADITLRVPLIRQLYGWCGIRRAGAQSMRDMFEVRLLHLVYAQNTTVDDTYCYC